MDENYIKQFENKMDMVKYLASNMMLKLNIRLSDNGMCEQEIKMARETSVGVPIFDGFDFPVGPRGANVDVFKTHKIDTVLVDPVGLGYPPLVHNRCCPVREAGAGCATV